MPMIPDKVAKAAKAWVALLGVVVAAVTTTIDDVPQWLAVVGSVLAALAVYFTPNRTTEDDTAA